MSDRSKTTPAVAPLFPFSKPQSGQIVFCNNFAILDPCRHLSTNSIIQNTVGMDHPDTMNSSCSKQSLMVYQHVFTSQQHCMPYLGSTHLWITLYYSSWGFSYSLSTLTSVQQDSSFPVAFYLQYRAQGKNKSMNTHTFLDVYRVYMLYAVCIYNYIAHCNAMFYMINMLNI